MHGAQTSVGQKDKGVSVNDLKSPAISVAKTTRYRLSHQRAGRSYAAIALAQVALNQGAEV
jgi:hypothetical protein